MKKHTIQITDALTGEITTQSLTQEFIASLPTQAQWDAIGAPPAKPDAPTVNDGGAQQHPDGTGGYVAQYNVQPPAIQEVAGTQYFIACNLGDLSEIVTGMCEPNHLLDIHAGRSFFVVARNQYGETKSDIVSSDNAHTYDALL
jgi:hypothetical protein